MKTYKMIVRKSDGQLMEIVEDRFIETTPSPQLFSSEYGIKHYEKSFPDIDWSLYDLIEVAVIPTADIPSEEETEIEAMSVYDIRDYNKCQQKYGFVKGAKWMKSQIFK